MNEKLKQLQSVLADICQESDLLLKFEVDEYELEPAQDDTFLDVKENNPDCAVAVGIGNEYMQRVFVLDEIESNVYSFVEISQKHAFFNVALRAEDGIWDINVIETREGENW
ncbi:hypothetical protein [Vibrio methylphosphonaticus]|uniref:hypothetical protein n=1 Tax=Vibrio methylphosphonaticus TaxID=2946866 RepID=UPI002029DE3B|nr:hypothetical protein [Vibrio methylphosphonaticus]MCL9775727.1 hypothetical protein [Vibrio methylphosphonaticus]